MIVVLLIVTNAMIVVQPLRKKTNLWQKWTLQSFKIIYLCMENVNDKKYVDVHEN
jgi:hypothetical protein